jgi:hypothetical protein
MSAARLSIFCLTLAALLMEVGVMGAHSGAIAPRMGFAAFLTGGATAIAASLFGLVGTFRTAAPGCRPWRAEAAVGLALGVLIAVPAGLAMWRWYSMGYPSINDITTDYDDPPLFVDPPGLSVTSTKYDRARLAPIQARYYPTLRALRLDEKPDDAFARVEAAAGVAHFVGRQIATQIPAAVPGWSIVYIDPATRTLEGVETSYLFHFRDDFVIQVRPGPDANSSLVQMRSRSRHGRSDFGANYNRIREFFGMLKPAGDSRAAAATTGEPPG